MNIERITNQITSNKTKIYLVILDLKERNNMLHRICSKVSAQKNASQVSCLLHSAYSAPIGPIHIQMVSICNEISFISELIRELQQQKWSWWWHCLTGGSCVSYLAVGQTGLFGQQDTLGSSPYDSNVCTLKSLVPNS